MYTNVDGDVIEFPFYMVPGLPPYKGWSDRVCNLQLEIAPTCPVFHGVTSNWDMDAMRFVDTDPEFKVSSVEDLAEVAWFTCRVAFLSGHDDTSVKALLDIGRRSLETADADWYPGDDARAREPFTIEGDLVEEAMKVFEGLLKTRTLG